MELFRKPEHFTLVIAVKPYICTKVHVSVYSSNDLQELSFNLRSVDVSVVATFTVVVSSSVVGDDVVRVGKVVASAELVSVVTSVVPRLMSNGFNKMTRYLCQNCKKV